LQRRNLQDDICPVARSLNDIGEWWSLLILRDAMLGVRRFSDFQRRLGLAKNVLSARLKKMVARGIMEQVPATDGSAYQEYVLTEKGRALFPTLVALRQWGERYLFSPEEQRTMLVDKERCRPLQKIEVLNSEGEPCQPESVDLIDVDLLVDAASFVKS
jgi:DNA-binding HxlR family transcriptional regulator